MRFFSTLSLSKGKSTVKEFRPPEWFSHYLPSGFSCSADLYSFESFSYKLDHKSIVEQNWDSPVFENENHVLFVAGSIYYRLSEKDVKGSYVPNPSDVFRILMEDKSRIHYRLKGNFYLILYEKESCIVEVFSSPFALYPAWYIVVDETLYVSNIIECLMRFRKVLEFDERGLYEFSLFDHCLGNRTIYKGIKLLEGGKTLRFNKLTVTQRLDYDICNWFTSEPKKKSKMLESIDYTLKRHIGEFVSSSDYFGSSLTGGYDSRLNLAYIPESEYGRMQTMSYGKPGSKQHEIPELIASKLGFKHSSVHLSDEFVSNYSSLGLQSILFSGGITPFIRAMYPFAYSKAASFGRSFMLGQCDMIRPLSTTQPAGAIYNEYNWAAFFGAGENGFSQIARNHKLSSYFEYDMISNVSPDEIFQDIFREHIDPYKNMDQKTRFWFFLFKESMLKFWHTECHLVNLFVNDFISFADLDYIEALTSSQYAGLYKGLLAESNLKRLGAHDLYVDLMTLNNNKLNNIVSDRFYKPKWYKRLPIGYSMMALAKLQQKRFSAKGNDTFDGEKWHNLFIQPNIEVLKREDIFINLDKTPYRMEAIYRRNRFVSMKIWLALVSDKKV